MNDVGSNGKPRIQLRRYPNRRYYDATHSQHVTMEAIYQLVCDGHDVSVIDSKTGEDITGKVLTQIILEHDAPKLAVFPVELLHELIRTNEPLVQEFVEKYFSHAFRAFIESQRQFQKYLRGTMGLGPVSGATWPMMFGPIAPNLSPPTGDEDRDKQSESEAEGKDSGADLREMVKQLQLQVQSMQEELDQR
jgi:polyhydroxyalkanoate synthesis repressor PhaR